MRLKTEWLGIERQERNDSTARRETQIKYLCYLPSVPAGHHFALASREIPTDASMKIKEMPMQCSIDLFPKLRAEMLDKKRMWRFATANAGIQDRNPVHKRKEILRAWTVDPKHFCIVQTEDCNRSRSYSELSWRATLRCALLAHHIRGSLGAQLICSTKRKLAGAWIAHPRRCSFGMPRNPGTSKSHCPNGHRSLSDNAVCAVEHRLGAHMLCRYSSTMPQAASKLPPCVELSAQY